MKKGKWAILLALLLVVSALCMTFANIIQTNYGAVTVTTEVIETEKGSITYKLYRPSSATDDNQAPGVLLLHGYQNDKETNDAYAIELARRGVVVVSLDEYGHGSTTISMKNRGYVNHKVPRLSGWKVRRTEPMWS